MSMSAGADRALQETERWKQYIQDHPKESKLSAARISLAIQDSPLKYDLIQEGRSSKVWTRTLHIPKFFTMEDKKLFEEITSTFYTIFDKTIKAYKSDPAVRKLFRFSPVLEKLICRDPGYSTSIPMLRVDIFFNEKTKEWMVCEFNTDGTSAMFENNTTHDLLELNNVWNALHPDAEYMELMDSWADALLKIWEESGREGKPRIVITDILENAYLPELKAFASLFEKRGYVCEVEDIRHLDYDGQNLYSTRTGTRYDLVYRRAVTKDIQYHFHDLIPFVMAIASHAALLVGDFQTQIVHSKMINQALFDPALQKYFTKEENEFLKAHMPATYDLKGAVIPEVLANKNHWIIKPRDSYAARGVWAGVDVPEHLWKKLIRDFEGTEYIAQTYIPHYQSENIDLPENETFQKFSNMTGLYVYNGKFAGVYSRLADSGIISSQYNERMVPTLFLRDQNVQED